MMVYIFELDLKVKKMQFKIKWNFFGQEDASKTSPALAYTRRYANAFIRYNGAMVKFHVS